MKKTKKKTTVKPATFISLVKIAKTHKLWLLVNVLTSTIIMFIGLVEAYLIKNIIDGALHKYHGVVSENLTYIILLAVSGFVVVFFKSVSAGIFSANFIFNLRKRVIQHMRRITIPAIEKYHSGDLSSRLNSDINSINNFFENNLARIIQLPLLFTGGLVYLAILNWKLLLVSFAPIPVGFLGILIMTKSVRKFSHKVQEAYGNAYMTLKDLLSGFSIVKAFNLKEVLYNTYYVSIRKGLQQVQSIIRRSVWMGPIQVIIRLVPSICCITFGGYLIMKGNGAFTIGGLLAFFRVLNFLTDPVSQLPDIMTSLQQARGASVRVLEVLNEPVENCENKNPVQGTADYSNSIALHTVSFSYNNSDRVLTDIDLTVKKGKHIAIVGPSGSGKTTLFKLICGFYTPTGGVVEVNDRPLASWGPAELRDNIAYLSQDCFLFPTTVYENIKYGNREAGEQDIIDAAKQANAHEFIENLPDKYNTIIKEDGSNFSVGQKQRIALARAIIKKPSIILLDEPTSALDSHSESLFQQTIASFREDQTVLIVSHRLSTIRNVDEIVVLKNGRLVEQGRHEQLLDRNDVYRSLYEKQLLPV